MMGQGKGKKSSWIARCLQGLLGLLLSVICQSQGFGFSQGQTIDPVQALSPISVSQQNLVSLEQQGQRLYDRGQFTQAIDLWQQVAQTYQAQQDSLNWARVLSNLSAAYQQLGQWNQARAAIDQSLQLLQQPELQGAPAREKVLAQALNTQGNLALGTGQAEQALTTWEQATALYQQLKDDAGATRGLLNQAQAMRALGLYRRALTTLTQIDQTLQTQPDSLLKAVSLRSLGSNLLLLGEFGQSQAALQQSLKIAQQLQIPTEISAALLELGNVARSQQQWQLAFRTYQQALELKTPLLPRLQAALNQLSLLVDQQQTDATSQLITTIRDQLAQVSIDRPTLYARLNFARSLTRLLAQPGNPTLSSLEIARFLSQTIEQAREVGDLKAEAYGLGMLGHLYEQNQQEAIAQTLTQKALLLSQAIQAPEITYRWQWQLGRILKRQGDLAGSIAIYTEAFRSLQGLRGDLITISPEVQFSFRDAVEPLYRELVGLLLTADTLTPNQSQLIQARQVLESLQLAELENFFQAACLDIQPVQIEKIDPQTAVVYPIVLPDRLDVILSLPHQPLSHYSIPVSQSQVETTVEQLRQGLTIRSKRDYAIPGQKLYDWLVRPAAATLAGQSIQTLVFVLDDALRSIPPAALHDGEQFLIEKYRIALAPGLQLIAPRPLDSHQARVLAAGLTQAQLGFAPLDNVAEEVDAILKRFPGEQLLDQTFTESNLQAKLKSGDFQIVHLATHGQFSSNAKDTFIVAWNRHINIVELESLLKTRLNQQRRIDLLVFSACQTAIGDRRATLGLAGIAVKAGAQSTLASLWSINDEATASLMAEFYRNIQTNQPRAEALRQAQLTLLKNPRYQHPVYWSAYVLVGDWL